MIFIIGSFLIGLIVGWLLKRKKVEALPSGVRKFRGREIILLQPLLAKVAERIEEAGRDSKDKDRTISEIMKYQFTLDEILLLTSCGLSNDRVNVYELDYPTLYKLYDKVMKVNDDFFMLSLAAKAGGSLI